MWVCVFGWLVVVIEVVCWLVGRLWMSVYGLCAWGGFGG